MQLGAYSYLTKPYVGEELLAVLEHAVERKRLGLENKILKSELARHTFDSKIVHESKLMLELLNIASKVAPTDSPVLIQGASGTGERTYCQLPAQKQLPQGPAVCRDQLRFYPR